ncbi:MAG: DEAD/DEAH box helicase [Planctomycetota bacterium]
MDVDGFLQELRNSPAYRGQIVHVRETPARAAEYAPDGAGLPPAVLEMLRRAGVARLYSHQAEAIRATREGRDVLVVSGTASGKSLCYVAPILELTSTTETQRHREGQELGGAHGGAIRNPKSEIQNPSSVSLCLCGEVQPSPGTALLLFPTKALCQDQAQSFRAFLAAAGLDKVHSGVYDGDTTPHLRRKLRDHGAVIFSNPDMLHAALLPQHARWAKFLARLRYVVLDELHVYNGIFGANMANLLRRFDRVCAHYGSRPQYIFCSATVANPRELGERLLGRPLTVVERDGSPRGRRVYVLWNPPELRATTYRSRRSANVEAHELMAELVRRGIATITFSKAKMTAEMIHRYVRETLQKTAPHLAGKVTPYRGGYLAEERREIERRLFGGELLGVSATRALELGIDVGALEACIVAGYPGTLTSFFQQSGRAGRGGEGALVVLVGLDTAINQYVLSHPEYLFERALEQAVIDPDNPFVLLGHLRCAAHEAPVAPPELGRFGPHAPVVLKVLEENGKLRRIEGRWYHAAPETPQHEVALRSGADRNVVILDADSGAVLGEISKFDACPILHPGAIYMHNGETYRVLSLDFERYLATVKREEVDYYTYPYGGTDVDHIDACLREKPFGAGRAYYGEVTAHFVTPFYEKVRFYELDAISAHPLELPVFYQETTAVWIVPPEDLMLRVRQAGLDAHAGLRGAAYAARMLLPLFITCDTLDLSHSVGSVNSPWQTLFIYERHPLGLGYTARAYELLHRILPAVLDHIRRCPCAAGCPCCTGKPLRGYATWNVERAEAQIPAKAAALMILEGLLGDGTKLDCPDTQSLSDDQQARELRLEQALRRRLEREREPNVLHPIAPRVESEYPAAEPAQQLAKPDVARRLERQTEFEKDFRKRLAKKLALDGLPHGTPIAKPPPGTKVRGGTLTPKAFVPPPCATDMPPQRGGLSLLPAAGTDEAALNSQRGHIRGTIQTGNSLAARARKLKKQRDKQP